MRLAYADGAREEQAFAGGVDRVGFDKLARGKMCAAQRLIRAAECGFVAIERVLAIAFGDVGGGDAALFAVSFLTLAGAGDPQASIGHDADQAYAVADGTCAHGSLQRSAIGVSA